MDEAKQIVELSRTFDRLQSRIAELEAENARLREQRQPMTEDDAHDIAADCAHGALFHDFIDAVRATERHHGIGGGNAD